jgi:hypothetical protein
MTNATPIGCTDPSAIKRPRSHDDTDLHVE